MAYSKTGNRRVRLYQKVVEEILRSIRAGDFRPGSRLPSERELADMHQVSRVTIREAAIALEAMGVIEIRVGSGAFVRPLSSASELALPDVTAFDLTIARSIVEAESAALASSNISDAQLKRLAEIVNAMSVSNGNGHEAGDDLDREFHMTIAAASNNPALEHCVKELWRIRNHVPQVTKLYQRVCALSVDEREKEHQRIFEALAARDPSRARAAMREHFHRLFETMVTAQEAAAMNELRKSIGDVRAKFLKATST
ncbi:MAG: FadR/GntR family transcriptional regulator [Steroidobacteraceae bacterium]